MYEQTKCWKSEWMSGEEIYNLASERGHLNVLEWAKKMNIITKNDTLSTSTLSELD